MTVTHVLTARLMNWALHVLCTLVSPNSYDWIDHVRCIYITIIRKNYRIPSCDTNNKWLTWCLAWYATHKIIHQYAVYGMDVWICWWREIMFNFSYINLSQSIVLMVLVVVFFFFSFWNSLSMVFSDRLHFDGIGIALVLT